MDTVTLLSYLIAIVVPAFAVYLFVLLDVFSSIKPDTLALCMGWGAIGAFGLAWLVNNTLLDYGLSYATVSRGVAPVIEEFLKALVLIALVRSPRFRYVVDGAVYGIAVGLGFGLSENLFIYLPDAGEAVLGTAISRTLSTVLMHATASGLVGIALGRLRRSESSRRMNLLFTGVVLAVGVHALYNNLVGRLSGSALLLVAVGIGMGGGLFIAWQIGAGLKEEKRRFAETLGVAVGVSTGERRAIQQLGGAAIEQVFAELQRFFGEQHTASIRRLLILQANIGILQNNLAGPASDRLRAAWEAEIAAYVEEMTHLRQMLGPPVRLFLQSVFPADDQAMQQALHEELAQFDPTLIHTFDMFMRVSELATTFTPEQLSDMAARLKRVEIFKHVSLANLENLSRAIVPETFADGAVLFEQGDEGNAMYLIEEGAIDILVRERSGREKWLRRLQEGDVVGEFALLDGKPRSARARASGQVRLLTLQREVFTMFIQSRPQVVLAMLQYLAGKVRYTTQAVETAVAIMSHKESEVGLSIPEPDTELGAITGYLEPEQVSPQTPLLVGRALSETVARWRERAGDE